MSKESKLIKNTAIIAIGNICTKCISFFMLPLYTAILTTLEYGKIDLIQTYSALLIIIMTLQFEQGVFRYLIEVREDKEKQKEYIITTLWSVIIVNIIFVIVANISLTIANYEYRIYLILMVVCGALNGVCIQIPRGLGNNVLYAQASCIVGSLNVILNVVFVAVLKLGMKGMLIATILAYIVSTVYIVCRLHLIKCIKIKYLKLNAFKRLAQYSFPLIPYVMCWGVINVSDRALISLYLSISANGIYAAANKFPAIYSMLTNIFQLAWTESAAENINDESRDVYYQQIINKTIRFYSACNIGVIAIMPFLFNILINVKFDDAYYYIPILMIATMLHSIGSLYGSIFYAFKETNKVALTTLYAAIINVLINLVLIKPMGLYAASISSLIAYLVVIIVQIYYIRKFLKLKLEIKYLLVESIVYVVVLIIYYSRSFSLQLIMLILLIPYCCFQNREFLITMIKQLNKITLKLKKK